MIEEVCNVEKVQGFFSGHGCLLAWKDRLHPTGKPFYTLSTD